ALHGGALEADLAPGHTYFVTFRWQRLSKGRHVTYGRLELVPVDADAVPGSRSAPPASNASSSSPTRRTPGTPFHTLPSVRVSSPIEARTREDREAGAETPILR